MLGTLGYERKALGTGISLHGVSAGQTGVGPSTRDIERWLKVALEVRLFYGSFVKGTWREGSLARNSG